MTFIPLACDLSGGSGAGDGTLPCSVGATRRWLTIRQNVATAFGLASKKILKESNGVKRLRIGVRFPLLASFCDPIVWFRRVNNLKQTRGIEIRAALIVQNTVIIGLDSNRDIRQTGGEVRI
jgi:hypothetical protein